MKIIYINDEGGVSIVCPTPEALANYSIEAIAVKDVPAGKPFKIVDDAYLPITREARDAWRVDPSELTHGVGGESNQFGG
jgi:hypothetical protein